MKRPNNDPPARRGGRDDLVAELAARARNLYLTRQMLCTEAVLTALNQGLNGGLDDRQTIAMAAPFCVALGESGCLCGALSGAVMGTGLFLGRSNPYRHRRATRDHAHRLHDAFKQANGATCCRVLTRRVRNDAKAHFRHCADLTAQATELAARLILDERPELAVRADGGFITRRDCLIGGWLRRMMHTLRG